MVLCRLCLIDSEQIIHIFGDEGRKLNMSDILSEYFWFQIVQNDAISTSVCRTCWLNTSAFQSFHSNIKLAQEDLLKHSKLLSYNDDVKTDITEGSPLASSSKFGTAALRTSVGLKEEIDDEVECKQEPPDIEQVDVRNHSSETNDSDKVPMKQVHFTRKSKTADRTPKNTTRAVKPTAKQHEIDEDSSYSEEQSDMNNETSNDDDDDDDANERSSPNKPRRKTQELTVGPNKKSTKTKTRAVTNEHIRSICDLSCTMCPESFDTFLALKKHYSADHNCDGFVMCCERKLSKRHSLIEHVKTHLNPDEFKCTVCNARLHGRFLLKRHMDTHMTFAERPFGCADCPKRFTVPAKLAAHRASKHSREEDKKFECTVCKKRFMSTANLSKHVKQTHDYVPEICDFCGKVFKCVSNLNVHRREVHMGVEVPRKECNICGKWVRYLKKHMMRHNAEEETCTICEKKLLNKHSLRNHMSYVHGNRRHQCTLCDKTFSKPMSLREHMAVHTGKDLYTCLYCPKTFKSDSNMYSHHKKFHFEDWSKDREKRLQLAKNAPN